MASPLLARAPQCASCVRRITSKLLGIAPRGSQIRGKKTLPKSTTIKVQLLQNVPGYGRRGAIIPVTTGVMRNIWYPKHMAEYVTAVKVKELGLQKSDVVERDFAFKSLREQKLEKLFVQQQREETERLEAERLLDEAAAEAAKLKQASRNVAIESSAAEIAAEIEAELDVATPDQTVSVLERLLPANLDFYRTAISVAPPKRVSPSLAAQASSSTIAKAAGVKTSIYGSVSTSDIAENMKAILAEDEEGSRISLSAADISFVEEMEDKDRVKHLGVFQVKIKVEGAAESVMRTIKVTAQG